MVDRKHELEIGIGKLRRELASIESREDTEHAKKLVGKCFRYRNSYGSGEKWWQYVKVLKAKGATLHCLKFETRSNGEISIEADERRWVRITGNFDSSYEPITASECARAWRALQKKVAAISTKPSIP